jgi:type IV secretion system protein VirD4
MYRTPRKPGFIGALPWAPVVTFFATVILGNWFATQRVASHYTGLGAPLLSIRGYAIYPPFRWAAWLWQSRFMPGTARMPLVWAFVTAFASLILAMILGRVASTVRLRRLSAGGDDLHGSARFATRKDIEKAGLLGQEEGLFVGG